MTSRHRRPDISDKLIHFTRGGNPEEAYARLKNILHERRLVAADGMIKGGYRCLCFTEAPLPSLSSGLVNSDAFSRYDPFGVLVEKNWLL